DRADCTVSLAQVEPEVAAAGRGWETGATTAPEELGHTTQEVCGVRARGKAGRAGRRAGARVLVLSLVATVPGTGQPVALAGGPHGGRVRRAAAAGAAGRVDRPGLEPRAAQRAGRGAGHAVRAACPVGPAAVRQGRRGGGPRPRPEGAGPPAAARRAGRHPRGRPGAGRGVRAWL